LKDKFPDSPRVETLIGIRMEAEESLDSALKYYEGLLEKDPTNIVRVQTSAPNTRCSSCTQAAWKRQIAVLRRQGKIEQAVKELSQFLDTFYTDAEGWLELADIYVSCNQYIASLIKGDLDELIGNTHPFTGSLTLFSLFPMSSFSLHKIHSITFSQESWPTLQGTFRSLRKCFCRPLI
jgi:ER membrane protein complex subunit 2